MKPYFLMALMAVGACTRLDYDPLTFRPEGNALVLEGAIDGSTVAAFQEAIASNPSADTLILQNIPGSVDDEANLVFSRMVRDRGMTTVVPADGMVASGGTDLFVAGKTRTLEPGACVGVHSWSAGDTEGRDVPMDDPEHQNYLTYYAYVGIPSDFYWYTLNAAPAADMHWMSAQEINSFQMTSARAERLSTGEACEQR